MKTIITTNGLNIIGQNSGETATKYWIGYFGLAYVPDELRAEGESDELKAGMTKLTIGGDNIYNLFQGSMKPEGFNTDIGDSAAGKLYNECLYTSNVMSRFRYVMDKDEVNHLVVFRSYVDEDTNEDGIREYCQFDGIDDSLEKSGLPIPAPLYYLGEPYNYSDIPDSVKADLVSCDTRTYSASDSTNSGPGYDEASWDNSDKYGWAETLGNTYTEDVSVTKLTNNWQFQSVSNYNRFHAPANSAGYAVGYDPACRNIAKATKLFPIGHYDVLSTKSDTKVAKVQYSVDINMKNVFTEVANRTTRYFDESGEQVPSSNYKMSFKFNRVGIYAVPVALHAYTEPGENQENCTNYELQMQITGNSEPVLFAVMDLDAPVIMSEDGCLDYKLKFNVDYSADNSDAVDSTSIFYNLYEDDAITWYKNQLIANASTANAITSLGVQMGYLRKQINSVMPWSTTGCTINDKGNAYAYISSTSNSLKNLKDSDNTDGALRGVGTVMEGDTLTVASTVLSGNAFPEQPASIGLYTMSLGANGANKAPYSISMMETGYVGFGYDSESDDRSEYVFAMGGSQEGRDKRRDGHLVVSNSRTSFINACSHEFNLVNNSLILDGALQAVYSGISNSLILGVNDDDDIVRTSSDYWYNMLLLGDYTAPGKSSSDSIVIGTNSAVPFINLTNSVINVCVHDNPLVPSTALTVHSINNTIWWGEARDLLDLTDNATTEEEIEGWKNSTSYIFSDAFVFLGKYNDYGSSDWLGIGPDMAMVGRQIVNTGYWPVSDRACTMQPYMAPMIFTGGIALGGPDIESCTYGLMKLGTQLGHASTFDELRSYVARDSMVSVSSILADSARAITPIYDGEHFTVMSPHAGKVLTVLEEQELDGTLHIGAKYIGSAMQKQVTIHTSYISATKSHRITVSTVTLGGELTQNSFDIFGEMNTDWHDTVSGIVVHARKYIPESGSSRLQLYMYAHPDCTTYYTFTLNTGWFSGIELYSNNDQPTDTVSFYIDGASNLNNICYVSMLGNQAFNIDVQPACILDCGDGPNSDYRKVYVNDSKTVYTFDKDGGFDNPVLQLTPVLVPDNEHEGVPITVGLSSNSYDPNLGYGKYPYTWFISPKNDLI